MISLALTLIGFLIIAVFALFALFAIICELSTSEKSYPILWVAIIATIVWCMR